MFFVVEEFFDVLNENELTLALVAVWFDFSQPAWDFISYVENRVVSVRYLIFIISETSG